MSDDPKDQVVPIYAYREVLPLSETIEGDSTEYVERASYDRLYAYRLELEQKLRVAGAALEEVVELEDLIETNPGVGMHEDPAGHAWTMANTAREAIIVLEAEAEAREPLAEGRDHLTEDKVFRSDKYPWCRDGFVPLKLTDPDARKVLRIYADCHQERDSDFSRDLLEAIANIERKERAR